MTDRASTPSFSAPPEGASGLVGAPEPGIEAQDVQTPTRAAGGRTADPDQLAALRTWLTGEALKIRHRLPHMNIPEVWQAMDGMAHGLEYTVRIIDRFAATGRLPVTGGAACDCADPETQHQAMAANAAPTPEAGR